MNEKPSLDMFLKKLITAPKARQENAVQSALALLAGAPPPDQLLYSGAQACRMISVSKPTLWRMVKSGTIVPVHLRGLTRYRKADLVRLAGGEGGQV